MNEILKQVLPNIAGFILGPVGGIAAKAAIAFLGDKLGIKADTKEELSKALSGWTPEQLLEAKKIDVEFQKFCLENEIKIDLAQIGVNTEEAKSSNWFVAGWRPAVGWICGVALAWATIIEPIIRFVATVVFSYKGTFPVIDSALTMQILFGMLGLGGLRTYEKTKKAS